MTHTFLRLGCVVIALLNCFALTALAGDDDISPQSLRHLRQRFATVRVAVDHAPFYGDADLSAPPLWHLAWVASLEVDSGRLTDVLDGWIPIKALGNVKGRNDDIPAGWVRRRDVVIPGDYKKVIGCWPVKSVTYVAGDYAVEATFKTDGSALVKEWGDEEWINRQPPHKAHVYMARNIVTIEASKKNGPVFFTSGYRPGERKLYPEGAPGKEQELFPEALLRDCPSIPILAR